MSHDLDAVLPEVRCRVPPAHAARARHRSAVPVAARVHGRLRAHGGARRRVLGPDALIMHPGPMNRGIEIAADVADAPNAVITEQVANGALGAHGRACTCCSARGSILPRDPKLVIKGGTVVDATGTRRADVAVRGGVIAAVGDGLDAKHVLDADGLRRRPRPRRPPHAPAPAGPGGSRDGRDRRTRRRARRLHRGRRHAEHRTGDRLRGGRPRGPGAGPPRRPATSTRRGRSPWAGGERLSPMAEMAELGVQLFTDDGAGVQDARPDAPGARVRARSRPSRWPSTARTPHSRAARHMHEGAWSSRLGHRRDAGRSRDGDGPARHRARAADRRSGPLPAPARPPGRSRRWPRRRPKACR